MQDKQHIYRGTVFFFTDSPLVKNDSYTCIPDGALAVGPDGKVLETGAYDVIKAKYATFPETDYSGQLIMPGLIDAHVHYPQTEIIGMYGKQLLDWLNEYTFPAEMNFKSPEYAARVADLFLRELFRNGTTTCVAYATVHRGSVDALFEAASRYHMRLLTGKVLMDQNAPEGLRDTVASGERESRSLIEKWHNQGRNQYVITPRFAITSSREQLDMAGRLRKTYPDTYIQTHLSENKNEIGSALTIHPGHTDYLAIYEAAGLITDRTLLGHCIHLSDSELNRIAAAGAIITHCPTSNLFLGSGLYEMERANRSGVQTVMATDVGGGTSFSMFKTLGESYKMMQVGGYSMSTMEAFYKSTLGTARALQIADKVGCFGAGMEADFIVVNSAATPVQAAREAYLWRSGKWSVENRLFGLQILGDDRNITATYLMGQQVH